MRPLLLALSVLCAGCMSDPPAERREAAARADVAAGRGAAAARQPAGDVGGRVWRGLDLSAAPVNTDADQLLDIWEERPPGSKSYEVRDDVTVIRPDRVPAAGGTVYWVRSRNRFYVQHDEVAASTHHFYGPFEGDPHEVLDPPPARDAGE